MGIVIGSNRRRSRSAVKRTRKFKWEQTLTESEREFVAQMNPLLIRLARRNTPYFLQRNQSAVEHSYMVGFKALCRAAKKYDSTLSAPMTYTFKQLGREIRAMWRTRTQQFRFDATMVSENTITRSDEELSLSHAVPSDDRSVLDVLADAEQCAQAFRVLEVYSVELANVMRLRYGFACRTPNGNYRPKYRDIKDIAKIVKRSDAWVSWAIKRSLVLLRACLKERI